MKKLFQLSHLWLLTLVAASIPFLSIAQDANKISPVKADDVWPAIKQVVKQQNLQVDDFDASKGILVSSYEEYAAGLIKNRARYNFAYKNDELVVTLADKQTLSTSGWAASLIPSKKADDKLIIAIIEKVNLVLNDPTFMAKLKGAQTSLGADNMADRGTATAVVMNVSEAAPLQPSYEGAKQVKFEADDEYLFSEGLCALKKNDLWGFIDTLGNWVIEAQYFKWGGEYPSFSSGLCLVGAKAANGYGNEPIYIDKTGKRVFANQKFANASPFRNGIAMVSKESGPYGLNVYSFINTQGAVMPGAIIPGKQYGLSFQLNPFSDGLTRLWDDKKGSYGFIDNKGKWVVMPKDWGEAGDFGNGRGQVQNKINYYWGFIDKKGNTAIPFDYKEKPGVFSCGRSMVKNENRQVGYIDVTGNLVLGFKYTTPAFDFHNGFAVVTIDDNVITRAIIDTTGKVVKVLSHNENVMVNSDGNVTYTGKIGGDTYVGVVAPDGTEIVPLSNYTIIKAFGNNLAYAEFYEGTLSDTKTISGFINRKGKMVIVRQPQ